MRNINSGSEIFEGKKIFDNTVHHKMPKIKFNNKRRRRITYQGIINQQEPAPLVAPVLPFKT